MERSAKVATIPCDFGWTDVGSWDELWNVSDKDAGGNVVIGDAVVAGARNSYIRGDGRLVAASGVENLILVATDDAVLVLNRNYTQDIRAVIERLKHERRSELVDHSTVQMPWGVRCTLPGSDLSRVRRLTINPGMRIAVQCPAANAAHLVVVTGTAQVALGAQSRALDARDSTDVPGGTTYRIENPGLRPVELVEMQFGPAFEEDDILFLESPKLVVEATDAPTGKRPDATVVRK